ncbi:hypothetical protein E8E14_013618 [Neopestalotiopsis sp. 37M]|nr:hypothetical protein E8E14_013618 [Neopestalotiopsis sp. 37M]
MQSAATTQSAQEPSSSLVLEHVCLFTRDIKRKQKRWQDGRLKFHVFNKRIMVYDDRGNFIGDSHWREDYEFGDGEEFQLERGAVLVQAAECVAEKRQDLSELIDKRLQEKMQRQSAAAARSPRSVTTQNSPHASKDQIPLRHTPLLSVLGTPSGHHGRALVPSESPYEQKKVLKSLQSPQERHIDTPEPARHRRREMSPQRKSGYATSLFGAALTLSGRPMSSAPPRQRSRPALPSSDQSNRPVEREEASTLLPKSGHQDHDNAPLAERRAMAVNIRGAQSAGQAEENKTKPRALKQRSQNNVVAVVTSEVVDLTAEPDNQRRSTMLVQKNLIKESARLPTKRAEKPIVPEVTLEEQSAPVREPRIELRMAPSKKRGLLFLSEKITKKHRTSNRSRNSEVPDHDTPLRTLKEPNNSSLLGTAEEVISDEEPKSMPRPHREENIDKGIPAATSPDPADHDDLMELSISPEIDCSISTEPPRQSAMVPAGAGLDDSASHESAALSSIRCEKSRDSNDMPSITELEDASKSNLAGISHDTESIFFEEESRGHPFANQRGLGASHPSIDDFDEMISRRPQNVPPPRLAKLRNSIRSREIIGIFPEEFEPSMSAGADGGEGAGVTVSSMQVVSPREPLQQKVHRVANPATRGRKAARPSDAAGQVPEPGITTENRVIESVIPKPSNASAALPGFAKANGGPWSREAQDLFEYRRPE